MQGPVIVCLWCRRELEASRRDAKFCSRKCRQAAWRLRGHVAPADPGDASSGAASGVDERRLRFAYADPPYPGMSKRFYEGHPDYQGEVDHVKLIESLRASGYDGWALSTSAKALRDLLPLCPPEARVCAWIKPHGVSSRTFGLHNVWEPIIVLQGRRLRPGRADGLIAHAARGGGDLMGRKPLAFCGWLFSALGMLPGDELVDLFPGTGVVARSWGEVCRSGPRRPVARRSPNDASPLAGNQLRVAAAGNDDDFKEASHG